MNKQSQLTLTTHLNLDPKGIHSAGQQHPNDALKALTEQHLTARNIAVTKHTVQMDVLINNSWQTLRLSTEQANPQLEKFLAATIQLSSDGKQLTISPLPVTMTLSKAPQLHALLNLLTQGDSRTTAPLPANLAATKPALQLPVLNTEFVLNNTLAALLKTETPLKAVIVPASNKHNEFSLTIINRFGDSLHQQSISQQKVAELLAKLTPELNLKLSGQQVQLNLPEKPTSSLTVPLNTLPSKQVKNIQAQWQLSPLSLIMTPKAIKDTITLINQAPAQQITLKNSLAETFIQALQSQRNASPKQHVELTPLSTTDSPIRSWLKGSFADLKTRITDAVRYFEKLPAANKATNNSLDAALNTKTDSISQLGFNAKRLDIVKLAAFENNRPTETRFHQSTSATAVADAPKTHAPLANTSGTTATIQAQVENPMLPVSFTKSAPLVQLFQLIKASVFPRINSQQAIELQKLIPAEANKTQGTESPLIKPYAKSVAANQVTLTQPPSNVASLKTQPALTHPKLDKLLTDASNTLKMQPPYLALKEPNLAQPLQPIRPLEAALIAKLLPLPNTKSSAVSELPVQLSQKINELSEQNKSPSVDLNRLVNQAFNRMISNQNVHPSTIERELLSIIRPSSLTPQSQQASFTQGLEQLAITTLAAPIVSQAPTNLSFNNQTGLDALLQVLVPNFKAVNSNKLLEQLQQPSLQAMAAELSQVKTALTQVQATPINQQQDASALAQFFLPMKLPPETGQTEISLGQYKKPSKNKLESKNVWFVRLNFDFATLGKLQVTAEVMDTAVDCQLLASSQEVTALAHPHLDTLRHKLASHGLNVGELSLKQGATTHQAFYKLHAIINIKV